MKNHFIQEALTKQSSLTKHFMKVISQHQLSHAYLFSGEAGTGKLAVALTIAMRCFCLDVKNNLPCGNCNECLRITKREHPDVLIVEPQGQRIRIQQIRLLKAEFSKSAVEGNLKILMINNAEKMTDSAANGLLKFIEEPAGNVICFLLTNDLTLILPTIVSRTQIIKFASLSPQLFYRQLKRLNLNSNQYNLLATMTNNLVTVKQWNQNDWFGRLQQVVERWFQYLIRLNRMAFPFIQMQILPLIKNHQGETITLNMIIQVWCDVMNYKFEAVKQTDVKFPQIYQDIKNCAQEISTSNLLAIIDLTLNTNQALSYNVTFQNILETITLKILDRLRFK